MRIRPENSVTNRAFLSALPNNYSTEVGLAHAGLDLQILHNRGGDVKNPLVSTGSLAVRQSSVYWGYTDVCRIFSAQKVTAA